LLVTHSFGECPEWHLLFPFPTDATTNTWRTKNTAKKDCSFQEMI